jgi:hypothetical protein
MSSLAGHHAKVFQRPRQRDGAKHGVRRLIEDSRRLLFLEYLRYVEFFRP